MSRREEAALDIMRSADAEPNAFQGHDCYRLYRVADRSADHEKHHTCSAWHIDAVLPFQEESISTVGGVAITSRPSDFRAERGSSTMIGFRLRERTGAHGGFFRPRRIPRAMPSAGLELRPRAGKAQHRDLPASWCRLVIRHKQCDLLKGA
jgi:hypothetical protein